VFISTGSGKPSDIVLSSSLFVETVEKKQGAPKGKRFHGDASRVVAQGNGLKKGFAGRAATFTLEVKDAGTQYYCLILISIIAYRYAMI
jgi:filamin